MTFLQYIFLFLSVLIGGGIGFFVKKNNREVLQMMLSFSGAYILGITVLHLIPNVFQDSGKLIGLWVLLGFLIQLLLEQFSAGVEHGHIHAPRRETAKFALAVVASLCVHSFMEGMPLSHYELLEALHGGHGREQEYLWIGIILHKAPAAFALVLLLLFSNFKKRTIWISLFLFATMSPLGAATSEIINLNASGQKILLAVVIGSFLHISTTILFEMDNTSQHKISFSKMLAIISGLGIAILTIIF